MFQSVTTSVSSSLSLVAIPLSISVSRPVLFAHAAGNYVTSTAAAEREDTHERTTPHLLETAVLSRNYTSTDKNT